MVVLLNNGVLGMVRQWQSLFYEKRYSNTILNDGVDFVKLAEARDWEAAIGVAWITFQQISAQVCDEEGARCFRDGLTSTQLYIDFLQGKYQLFCAYDGSKLIGMISLRNETHISLLFVDENYHKQGIIEHKTENQHKNIRFAIIKIHFYFLDI